jgi:hypothetical protein
LTNPAEQAGRNTAKVDRRFLVEKHIGRPQYNAREQVFILRRALAEHIDHLLAVLLHFLLLHRVADQDGAGRKAGLTSSVLRMEVHLRLLPVGRQSIQNHRERCNRFARYNGAHR